MTLDQKINEWSKHLKKNSGHFLGIGKRPLLLKELLVERMTVAYDLAAAFFYLHENRLVYRDIKPENIVRTHAAFKLVLSALLEYSSLILFFFFLNKSDHFQGFDIRGDVKVFDFGLCKSLSPELKAPDGGYGYRLTGRAGSLPYMAVSNLPQVFVSLFFSGVVPKQYYSHCPCEFCSRK